MRIYRLAIIGFGRRGRTLYGALQKRTDVRVTAVVDPRRRQLNSCAWYDDVHRLLTERALDAVVIATPPSEQEGVILTCCAAGIPALCEKPVLLSPRGVRMVLRSNSAVYPAYQLAHDHLIQKAFSLMGGRGGVEHAALTQRVRLTRTDWRWQQTTSGGGCLMDNGSHLIHLALRYFSVPKRVFCLSRPQKRVVATSAVAVLQYPTFDTTIHVSWNAAGGKETTIDLYTPRQDVHFRETNQSRALWVERARTRGGWTRLAQSTYYVARGLERDIRRDPFNTRGETSATDNLLKTWLDTLRWPRSRMWRKEFLLGMDTLHVLKELSRSARRGIPVSL